MNMNTWGNENFMHNMMPPLLPPMYMQGPENVNVPPMNPPPPAPMPLIGPVMPENMNMESHDLTNEPEKGSQGQAQIDGQTSDVSSSQSQSRRSRDHAGHSRRDKDRNDRGRNRSRSRDRHDRFDRKDRNDRGRNDRSRNQDRKSKWDNDDKAVAMQVGLNMPTNMNMPNNMSMGNMSGMPAMMQQFPNMMGPPVTNMMGGQMDGPVPMMHGMNMMQNMPPNMMDQNMMMMNQQMMSMMPNQQIFITNAVLLPPIPGAPVPQRREKPHGCRSIFIGGLTPNVTPDVVHEIFQRFGTIEDIKSPRNGVFYVRFQRSDSVESSFFLTGYRLKFHDQMDSDATTLFVDYALNREDQNEYDKNKNPRGREPTPPRFEPFTPTTLTTISEKIKSETDFAEAAPTLAIWLERGECNKKYANQFYSLIQASNNQLRRLFNEKMQLDEEFQNMKTTFKQKFAHVVLQFEQVAKILSAAKHQRVSDHFTKQQRRNIEMWLKMTEHHRNSMGSKKSTSRSESHQLLPNRLQEAVLVAEREVENLKEEFNSTFDEEDVDRPVNKNMVPLHKYEELQNENKNLYGELEGYKQEAYLAKTEAERNFEKFKAHFIAQQALQNKQIYPPLPAPKPDKAQAPVKPQPPPPTPDDDKVFTSEPLVPPSEGKLISILTAFLLVHPLGASLDYLVSYVRSMAPNVTQATVLAMLQKYTDVFRCKTSGVGATIEHRWLFVTFDNIKSQA